MTLIEILVSQVPAGILATLSGILSLQLKRNSIVTTEYKILEETCTRQRGEIKDLNQEVGKLKERTDLQPVIEALNRHNIESNARFDKALQIQDQQSRLLEANTKAIEGLTRSHEQLMLSMFPGRHTQRKTDV